MGSWIFPALPSAGTAAIQLLAIGGMTVADQSVALTVRTVKGDCDHERLLILRTDWLSESTLSCSFVPLPKLHGGGPPGFKGDLALSDRAGILSTGML